MKKGLAGVEGYRLLKTDREKKYFFLVCDPKNRRGLGKVSAVSRRGAEGAEKNSGSAVKPVRGDFR
jgi:hypothetical protein